MKVYLHTNNSECEVNALYMVRCREYFLANGHELVDDSGSADTILFLGCGFDAQNMDHAVGVVANDVGQLKSQQKLVLGGCLPGMDENLPIERDKVFQVPLWDEDKFDDIFGGSSAFKDVSSNLVPSAIPDPYHGLFQIGAESDFFISIARGCVNNCSYCFIRKAKGRLQSVPIERITEQYLEGVELGHERFVLVSDDFGSYGLDIGTDCVELIKSLAVASSRGRFVINYIYPGRLVQVWDEIRPLFEENRFISMNIPLQTTSQRLLKLMNRRYSAPDVLDIIAEIRTLCPDIRLVTHCLVGFPTETHEEFIETLQTCRRVFDATTCFEYRPRPGVRAFDLGERVSDGQLQKRVDLAYAYAEMDEPPHSRVMTKLQTRGVGSMPQDLEEKQTDEPETANAALDADKTMPTGIDIDDGDVRSFLFAATFAETIWKKLEQVGKSPLAGLELDGVSRGRRFDDLSLELTFTGPGGPLVLYLFPRTYEGGHCAEGKYFKVVHDPDTPLDTTGKLNGVNRLVAVADSYLDRFVPK